MPVYITYIAQSINLIKASKQKETIIFTSSYRKAIL